MQKVTITQDELNQGTGRFEEYMKYIAQRLAAKNINPKIALFAATDLIQKDGYSIRLGSFKDEAAINVSRWFDELYGERQNISYYLPAVAYQINGAIHLLRMPILREPTMHVCEAVIDLTDQMANQISQNQFLALEQNYNEFYDAMHLISRLDKVTVTHLEASAQYLLDSPALYAQSRWEALHFVEKAMKEQLDPLGVSFSGKDGHDIKGMLHDEWMKTGKPALPIAFLSDAWCSAAMRYEKTSQPFLITLKAHHAAIRLGAQIAECLPDIQQIQDKLSIPVGELNRDAALAITRAVSAIKSSKPEPIKLLR